MGFNNCKPFGSSFVYISMKYFSLILCLCIATLQVFSQQSILNDFNDQQRHIDKTGFVVLGSWAAANIIYGGIATSGAHGSNKYFSQMNALWNTVNLGLAVMGYVGAQKNSVLSYEKSLKKQESLEKTFLFNAGLDLAYIGSGLYLNERSKNVVKDSDKFKGYGESVLFQAGGLLIFDVIMYSLHKAHGKKLYKLAEKVQLTATCNGVGVLVRV